MRDLLDDPADWVRLLNAALAAYTLVIVSQPRCVDWWRRQDPPARFLLLGLVALLVVAVWAMGEAVWTDLPGAVRTLLYTPALAWCAYGATTLHRYLRRHPHDS